MLISLLTDFGLQDGYVGTLKGVIQGISPKAQIIDLSHNIKAFNILQGGFVLSQSYRYFPKGTIFVAIVDPGVGSDRKPILVKTRDYTFIGPDNGIFSLVLSEEKPEKIIHLQNPKYFLREISSTFHGRDIFVAVAAHLSLGVSLFSFGEELQEYQKLEEFFPQIEKKRIIGKIISIDRFGNLITNISQSFLEKNFSSHSFTLNLKGRRIRKFYSHYSEAKKGEVFLLFGSSRFLEIAINQDSAEKKLKVKIADQISLKRF